MAMAHACGCAMVLLFVILLARRVPAIGYHPGMLLLGQSRIAEILFCGLAPLLFGILCPHLPGRRQRRMVTVFAVLASLYLGLVSQIEFLAAYHRLAGLNTWVEDKVCLQTTNYTCWPRQSRDYTPTGESPAGYVDLTLLIN